MMLGLLVCCIDTALANTSVLFPSGNTLSDGSRPFEIVYGTKPRNDKDSDEPPWVLPSIFSIANSGI